MGITPRRSYFRPEGRFMMGETENRWLSMTEICQHLGVSRDTAIKWINKNNMPAHKIGRLWKFKISEVDEWVKSGGATEK